MSHGKTLKIGRLGACALLTGGILAIVLQPTFSVGQTPAAAGANMAGYTDDFAKLGFKFSGAASCANAQCHGADAPQEGKGNTTLAEFTQWSSGDPHAKGYASLTNEAGTAIAEKMKIEPTSARCVSCHSMAAPEKLRGNEFNIEEGVSCGACHGPDEKWGEPHTTKGWTDGQRKALKTHDALLKKWGLYDTKSPLARADMCTSCHLSIEADMVAAGHPEPRFELDFYSTSEEKGGYYPSQHWRDPATPFYRTTMWATGQAVAVRDSMLQLAQRAGAKAPNKAAVESAYMKAMAHMAAFRPVLASGVVKADAKAWEGLAQKLAAGMKAGKFAELVAPAKSIGAEAGKLTAGLSAAKFDRAKTIAMAQALAKDATTYKTYGEQGIEQQGYGILALYSSANPSKAEGDAGAKGRTMILESLLFPADESEMTAAKFAEGLKKVTPQIK